MNDYKYSTYDKILQFLTPIILIQYYATHVNYITIYLNFKDFEDIIGNDILVTHLLILSDLKESKKKLFLQCLVELSKELQKSSLRPPYESGDIQFAKSILNYVDIQDVKQLLALLKEIIALPGKPKGAKNKTYRGSILQKSPVFGELLFEREPISEQGLVGLFCSMLHILQNIFFLHNGLEIAFHNFEFIQEAFPDGSMNFIEKKKSNIGKKLIPFNVEFEFFSKNYISHGHLDSKEPCEFIICWENNLKDAEKINENLTKADKKILPKIIAIKDVLQTGKIELQ